MHKDVFVGCIMRNNDLILSQGVLQKIDSEKLTAEEKEFYEIWSKAEC